MANERRFVLPPRILILPGLGPPVAQPDWVNRFRVALAALRFLLRDDMSTTVRAIEARRLVDPLMNLMSIEGMPIPSVGVVGDQFAYAFDRWLVDFVCWLGLPSRE